MTNLVVDGALSTLQWSGAPRNLIDAGDFSVNPWQLGTTFNSIAAAGQVTADRWCANVGGSTVATVSKVANTQINGFTQALQWGRSAGDTHSTGISIGQVLESADCYRLQGLPLTLSFWAGTGANFAAGASGSQFTALLISSTGTDDTFIDLVSTGWTGAANMISTVITPATTAATRYGPFTATVPTAATQLGLVFQYQPSAGTTAGANEWIQLMGVQLEIGTEMTPFEHLDVAYVLEQCQRYLIVMNEGTTGTISGAGQCFTTSTGQIYIALPAPMRKAPTVTVTIGGFQILSAAGSGQAVTSVGSAATLHTPQAVGIQFTTGGSLSIGQGALLTGRSTNLGIIKIDADYA